MKRLTTITILCLILATTAWARYDEGKAAYDRGDYATALRVLRPLAEEGDPRAQNKLAVMYLRGHGVPQDNVEALAWFQTAADQGFEKARYNFRMMQEKVLGISTLARSTPIHEDFRIQLGAFREKAHAVKEAGRVNRVYKSVLGRMKIEPVRADLGKQGTIYRLRSGPLKGRDAAMSLCRKFSARKQGCVVVKP
jgi:TPR repeat protein